MPETYSIDTKLYSIGESRKFSMRDLLDYFSQQGSLRVSDLHLKVGSPPVYRVDGDLHKMKGPPIDAEVMQGFARVLFTEQRLADLETQKAVDASFVTEKMQFRLNMFYDNDGVAIAVRALETNPPEIESIGFPNGVWMDILHKQQGLVLVTGITGAGKSTTIASFIQRIAAIRPCRIITLEDPIEYRLSGNLAVISQREIGRNVPDFARGLRDCLREDPDIIFVGEMRDRESASWTLTAAETGHLVFSTLHTRDARGTVTRILDMFPANQQDEVANQLSLGLSHVISQKLVPRADGKGRVVAMEVLHNSYAVANLIRLGKIEQIYTQLQTRTKEVPEERMITMEKSLVRLLRAGVITPLEAERWANNASAFQDEMKHTEPAA